MRDQFDLTMTSPAVRDSGGNVLLGVAVKVITVSALVPLAYLAGVASSGESVVEANKGASDLVWPLVPISLGCGGASIWMCSRIKNAGVYARGAAATALAGFLAIASFGLYLSMGGQNWTGSGNVTVRDYSYVVFSLVGLFVPFILMSWLPGAFLYAFGEWVERRSPMWSKNV